tara:strand:+ start:2724 stop:2972 length:249 start_codon:yes stop_codon:yes gene_type:complete
MKVYKHDHPYKRMSKEEQKKVSILKLTPNRKYVKGIGMRDGIFYVIVEDAMDDKYLAYISKNYTSRVILRKIKDFISFYKCK